jgi:hypothetical protein
MKYEVEITRTSYSTITFGVEANSEEDAVEKAMNEAYNTSFGEDTADYEVGSCCKSKLTDEE